nr:hypothetical protein L203_03249 [Cryptococcus depauperatus CBS 7841]
MTDHPPSYAPTLPQILILPLPEATSFFQGPFVQGEVFVKGLGAEGQVDVQALRVPLTIQLDLKGYLPGCDVLSLYEFPIETLYSVTSEEAQTSPNKGLPTSHRFTIPLPDGLPEPIWSPSLAEGRESESSQPVPGTINLSAYNKGEIRYTLTVTATHSNQTTASAVTIEGTPQTPLPPASLPAQEVSETLTRSGIRTKILLSTDKPRLGQLIHLGVEVKPEERGKTGVAGLSSAPDVKGTLRRLRRIRVEFLRLITIHSPHERPQEHLSLLHSSGKSVRYPGANRPPPRLLFTLPTIHTSAVADQTWAEISMRAGWWEVQFRIRVSVGFGESGAASGSSANDDDWVIEHPITVLPRIWAPPDLVSSPLYEYLALDGPSEPFATNQTSSLTAEDLAREAREAYRLKGRDVVGDGGTLRVDNANHEEELPPPFETGQDHPSAGPSFYAPGTISENQVGASDLPTFLESEAQMRQGLQPLESRGKEREERQGSLSVGHEGLRGELASWKENDGYETFSQPPPCLSASMHARGSIDPPQDGETPLPEEVVGDVAARLGLDHSAREGIELMERLGLGDGTRVVDLQDDLPPGIDEPSLPALPSSFTAQRHPAFQPPPPHLDPMEPLPTHAEPPHDPPSFDASQAASAVGVAATSIPSSRITHAGTVTTGDRVLSRIQEDAPPDYERGGLPPYSQG